MEFPCFGWGAAKVHIRRLFCLAEREGSWVGSYLAMTKIGCCISFLGRAKHWVASRQRTVRTIGMVTVSGLLGTVLGLVGSLVQARFIPPDELGFVRKYSVVSGYAAFLSLGLFTILQREYPLLIGQGEPERARRVAGIVQSWCLLVSALVCGALFVVTAAELFRGHYKEASAWFIQIVAVWATVYAGSLVCMYRSGQEFERLAKGQLLSSLAGAAVIPVFWLWPFPAFVLRSVTDSLVSSVYLHLFRPVRVMWCLPRRELLGLVKRGMRLYVSDYLRYMFWPTIEIWLMLWFAGNAGVGFLVFSRVIIVATMQLSAAINQVYLPRLAHRFGQSGSIKSCLSMGVKPGLLNLGLSLCVTGCIWCFLPPIISYAFPKYYGAVPLVRILVLQTIVGSFNVLLYMVTVLEGYLTQGIAAIAGLGVFVGTALLLHGLGFGGISVAWGTLAGQVVFSLTCLLWLYVKMRAEPRSRALEHQFSA